jgi:hypothetical protein
MMPPPRGADILAAVVLAAVAGCGSTAGGRMARPQTVDLNWHENCGARADPIPITTRRLVVRPRSWVVELGFRNETHVALWVMRPHFAGSTYFGLAPYETVSRHEVLARAERGQAKPAVLADRFSPSRPSCSPRARCRKGDQAAPRRPRDDHTMATALGRDRLKSFLDLLLESLDEPASGAELAGRAYLSRFDFQRLVAAALGESPGAFRRRLLLERAA